MIALALATAVAAATVAAAQAPRISNGTVTAQPAAAPLTRSFQSLVASQEGVAWIGYSVPALPKEGTMCCAGSGNTWVSGNIVVSSGDACCTACRIEPGSSTTSTSRSTATAPAGPGRPAARADAGP
jgi:hypothetical protein